LECGYTGELFVSTGEVISKGKMFAVAVHFCLAKGIFSAICLHLHCLPNTSGQSDHSYQKNKNGCPSAVHQQTLGCFSFYSFISISLFFTLNLKHKIAFFSQVCALFGSRKDMPWENPDKKI